MKRNLMMYKRIRMILKSINDTTDNVIIANCNIVKPVALDKGRLVESNNKNNRKFLARSKKNSFNRTTEDRRKG